MKKFAIGSLALASIVGIGAGSSFALWQDNEDFTTSIGTGKMSFGVGDPGQVIGHDDKFTKDGTSLDFTFGKDAATTLVKDKRVAIPIEVDAMIQGTSGMSYNVTIPKFEKGVFAESDVRVFQVNKAEDCTADNKTPNADDLSPTIIEAGVYKSSVEPVKQYWCVVADLKDTKLGKYTNDATVTGQDDTENSDVTATDSWTGNVIKDLKPNEEPDHTLTFEPNVISKSARG